MCKTVVRFALPFFLGGGGGGHGIPAIVICVCVYIYIEREGGMCVCFSGVYACVFLCLTKKASLICNFSLSVAAHTIV